MPKGWEAHLAARGCDVEDVAGFLLTKQREQNASNVEQSEEIGFELLADLLVANFLDRAEKAITSVVD
jgi:hypothetical protein